MYRRARSRSSARSSAPSRGTASARTRNTARASDAREPRRGDHHQEADDAVLRHRAPNPRARDRREPRHPGESGRAPSVRIGRDLLPRGRIGPRRRRVRRPIALRAGQRSDHGAADRHRCDEAGERQAHHGGRAVLRLLPAGQEGALARADQRQARRRHALHRRRRPDRVGRPALGPDPGVSSTPRSTT